MAQRIEKFPETVCAGQLCCSAHTVSGLFLYSAIALAHTQIGMTMDLYSHIMPWVNDEAADEFRKVLPP